MLNQTPNPIWTDGIHYVRRASSMDAHPMRWVVGSRREAGSKYRKHSPSLDEALYDAMAATALFIGENPGAKTHLKACRLPAASTIPQNKRGIHAGERVKPGRKPLEVPYKEAFSTTHFTCIAANPYAQVWQCTSYPGERKPAGRRKKDGHQPDQTPFRHQKGECSVLIGPEPIRDHAGRIRIFPLWAAAEDYALELYESAPEEEVITWPGPYPQIVGATPRIDIMFNPDELSVHKPFGLWLREHGRWIWRDTTRTVHEARDRSIKTQDPRLLLAQEESRSQRRRDNRVASFLPIPLTFRSIWEAEKEADRRERMLRGESA